MCINCYEEIGEPKIVNDRTKEAAKLIDAIYDCDNGGSGGYAHIVVDDWNMSDASINYCIKDAIRGECENFDEELQQASLNCLNYLKTLTEDERYSALAIQEGLLKIN